MTDSNTMDTQDLFLTLKKILKGKKITYKMLAEGVGISESTLKSIFYNKNTSIEKMLQICEYIQFPFIELVKLASRNKEAEFKLTYEQESFFADNPHYYYFFREHFFQKKSADEISKQFNISERSCYLYLRKLEEIGLLELHPGGKVKYKVSGKQRWLPDGPWYNKFLKSFVDILLKEIHHSKNNYNNYTSNIGFATLSQESLNRFIFDIKQVEKKYKEIAFQDYLMNKNLDGIEVSWNFNFACIDVYSKMTDIPELQ